MPLFQVELDDGRAFEIEADSPPSEQDVLGALGMGEGQDVGFDNRIPRKSIDEFKAFQDANSTKETMNPLERLAANPFVGGSAEVLADIPMNLYNLPAYAVNALAGKPVMATVQRGQPVVPELLPEVNQLAAMLRPNPNQSVNQVFGQFTQPPSNSGALAGGIKGVEDLARGLSTPEVLMTLGAGAAPQLAPKVAGTFGMQMTSHLPEVAQEVGRTSVEGTDAEFFRNLVGLLGQAGLITGIGYKGVMDTFTRPRQIPVLEPEVVGPKEVSAQKRLQEPERQAGEVIDLEPVKTGEGTVYRPPGENLKQLEGPKGEFVGDALGRVMRKEQVDPLGGSEPYYTIPPKKPFSGDVPVLDTPEAQVVTSLKAIEAKLNEFVSAQKGTEIVPGYQAAGQPKQGGQVSFAGEAGVTGIPNARQSATMIPPARVEPSQAIQAYDAASFNARQAGIIGEGQSSTGMAKAPQIEDGISVEQPLNPGGAESSLAPELSKKSQENNSLAAFAKQYEVEYIPGDTGKTILQKIQAKKASGSTVESVQKEVPTTAAIRTPDGRVFTGQIHATAVIKAMREGVSTEDVNKSDRGFWTNKERYITEQESKEMFGKTRSEEFGLKPKTGLAMEKKMPTAGQIQHILGNVSQQLKYDEYLGDLSKEQVAEFRRRGDEAFGKIGTDPKAAFEEAKRLNEEVKGSKKDPRTGENLYSGLFFLDPKFWEKNFGKNSYVRQDAQQLYNVLRNKMNAGSKAWKELDTPEFREWMKAGVKRTPGEVQEWVRERGVEVMREMRDKGDVWWKGLTEPNEKGERQVEKVVYGMDGKGPEAENSIRIDELRHRLDTAGYETVEGEIYGPSNMLITRENMRELPINIADRPIVEEYLNRFYEATAQHTQEENKGLRATSAYDSVSAFPTKEPMPEWTTSKEGRNVQRVDVVIPRQGEKSYEQWVKEHYNNPKPENEVTYRQVYEAQVKAQRSGGPTEKMLWSPDNLHENLPNTLGWAMIQYKTGPKGEKIAVVVEAQSRWGQKRREILSRMADDEHYKKQSPEKQAEMRDFYTKTEAPDHPLLKDYNRLIVKAAIEQAHKEGATHVMIIDADGAMLAQGHDLTANMYDTQGIIMPRAFYETEAAARRNLRAGETIRHTSSGRWGIIERTAKPKQEPGMRFNYDTALPRIAEELTGGKGERVSLGEHKNARNQSRINDSLEELTRRGVADEYYRSNLIFKNPDGSPKTDVSGLMFELNPKHFERKIQPAARSIGSGMQSAVAKNQQAGAIPNPFRKKNRPLNEAEFLDVQSFGPYPEELRMATTPQGIGKVPGLSRLFDPRAYRNTAAEKGVIANSVGKYKAANFIALWMERLRDVQRVFEPDKNGQVTLANGKKDYAGDVIEREMANPGSQPLTREQRRFVQAWTKLRKQEVDRAIAEGLKYFVDEEGNVIEINENYFPRTAIGKRGIEAKAQHIRKGLVGSKPGFTKKRQFKTMREGVEKGKIIYEPDEIYAIGRWLIAIRQAIADQRLSNDPALQGRTVGGPAKFLEEGPVNQPVFYGRVFPKDVADKLNAYYNSGTSSVFNFANRVNNELKAAQYTLDASAPLNQGLPLLAVNPAAWTRATLRHFNAFLDDRVITRYLKKPENLRIAKLIIEGNGTLIRPQDFLEGAGSGHLMHKVPWVRASARAMTTFLSLAKIEFFKAFEATAKKEGAKLEELVEAVEQAALTGKMEMIGLTPGRMLAERLLFNAPSYMRAFFNLSVMAGQKGIAGKVGRRALASLATGMLLVSYAIYKAMDMDEKEIEERMDPRKSSFLRMPYMMNNGRRKEVSIGGILISSTRTLGQAFDKATTDKEWGSGQDDPFIKWASSRKSPLRSLATTLTTGEDYFGEPVSKAKAVAQAITPISISSFAEEGFTESGFKGAMFDFFGLNSFNESAGAFRRRKQDEVGKEQFGKRYEDLPFSLRGKVEKEVDPMVKNLGEEPTAKQILNVQKNQMKRREELVESLSEPVQEWLAANKLRIEGYSETTSSIPEFLNIPGVKGQAVRLANDEEREMLAKLVSENVEKMVAPLVGREGVRQETLDQRVQMAKRRAWAEMRKRTGK